MVLTEPLAVAAARLDISREWLTRLCKEKRVAGAVLVRGFPKRWMVPIGLCLHHIRFKQARKGTSRGVRADGSRWK